MLKPTIKGIGVTVGERYLARLAESTFVGLWSYPSVYRDEGLAKNGIGQETADLLVVFGNTIIIFSEKDISFNGNIDIKIAWGRWCRKAIFESIVQLRGSEAFIRSYPNRLFLDKECKEPFPFDTSPENLRIHLVAVTRNSGVPCKKFFDNIAPGSSNSLFFQAGMSKQQVLENPFFITDFDSAKTFVHVLDDFTLDLLMEELDTVTDFIHYLQEKERVIRAGELALIPGEEEFLAYYLNDREADGYGRYQYDSLRIPRHIHALREGQWENFKSTLDYALHRTMKKDGKYWLELLSRFSAGVLDAKVGEGQNLPFQDHERVLRFLSSENRVSRAMLSRQLLEKYESVPTNIRSARLAESICQPGRLYIFLFFPRSDGISDYAKYRKERLAFMEFYAFVAKYKYEQHKEIIVLGIDSKNSQGTSETVIAIDFQEDLTAEQKVEAQYLMRSMEILNSTRPLSRNPRDSLAAATSGLPRKAPCPCGSGKKAKRCCLK